MIKFTFSIFTHSPGFTVHMYVGFSRDGGPAITIERWGKSLVHVVGGTITI
jgi:hypothetical protein